MSHVSGPKNSPSSPPAGDPSVWHHETLTVPPDPASSCHVRRWATGHLRRWQLPANTIDAVMLMLSEAVTNAVVQAAQTAPSVSP